MQRLLNLVRLDIDRFAAESGGHYPDAWWVGAATFDALVSDARDYSAVTGVPMVDADGQPVTRENPEYVMVAGVKVKRMKGEKL